jgi:hypothetical protein
LKLAQKKKEFIHSLILSRSFATEAEAARAYDQAAVLVYGRGASLNFLYHQYRDFEGTIALCCAWW